jgi:hypothetical protein
MAAMSVDDLRVTCQEEGVTEHDGSAQGMRRVLSDKYGETQRPLTHV